MIARCMPAGVLPDSTIFCTSSAYRSGFSSLYFSWNLRGFLPEYRTRRLVIECHRSIRIAHSPSPMPEITPAARTAVTVMLRGCHGFAISFTSNGLERLTATRQLVMDREKGSRCE